MRADGVVDFFPVAEFAVEFFHLQRAGRYLVELLGVGAIGAFAAGHYSPRKHVTDDATILAGLSAIRKLNLKSN